MHVLTDWDSVLKGLKVKYLFSVRQFEWGNQKMRLFYDSLKDAPIYLKAACSHECNERRLTVSAWIFIDWEQCLAIDNMVPVNSRV